MKDHLSTMHKIGTMSLVCKMCPYSTTSKGCLRSHIQAKHTVKNHKKCPYCEYHTHSLHRIQIHIDGKHPEHDKKNFSCDHCSRRFIFENSLKNHMDTIRNGPKNLLGETLSLLHKGIKVNFECLCLDVYLHSYQLLYTK